jgi:hypothetical protein
MCGLVMLAVAKCETAISLGVAPPIIELSVPQGGVHMFDLRVCNQGDGPLSIRAYVLGIKLAVDGTPIPLKEGEGQWSCANWTTLDKTEFELPSGKTQAVRATIRVPWGVAGGRYATILFEATPILPYRITSEVALGARVGAIVMESVPHTLVKDGEVLEARISDSKKNAVVFTVEFRNTGNVHVKAKGSVVIKNIKGRIIDTVPLNVDTGTVLPGSIRVFEATWSNPKRMEKGDYSAEVRINYGGMKAALGVVHFHL